MTINTINVNKHDAPKGNKHFQAASQLTVKLCISVEACLKGQEKNSCWYNNSFVHQLMRTVLQ